MSRARSRHRSRWWAAALVVTAMATAAACGGDDDDVSTGGTEADVSATTTAAVEDTAAAGTAAPDTESADTADTAATDETVAEGTEPATTDAVVPSSGGTLRYAYPIGPSRFDAPRSTVGQDIRIFTMVYDRLVHYDSSGALIPGLATDWTFSDDGMTLTLNLREGVTFHDGTEFNAEAVKANIERGKTVEGSSVVADLADISEVVVVDDYTVDLKLTQPSSVLPGLLSSRAGVMISPAAFETDLDFNPVGAGPYKVVEYRPDDVIIFEKYEDYWDDTYGGPDRVEWRIIADETTRLNALKAGEVDMALIVGSQMEDAENSGLTVDSRPVLSYQVLYLDRSVEPLAKQEVRQAMAHAVDREAFVDAVLGGAGAPSVQDFPEGYFAHNDDYPGDYYEYDPELAKQMLADAGYPDGFSLEVLVPALSTFELGAQVLQQMLAEVGITLTFTRIEAAQAGDLMFAQDQGDAMIAQFGGRSDPQISMDLQYTADGFLNSGDNTTEKYTELSAEAKAALDPDERQDLLQQMSGEVADQAFTLILAHDYAVNAYTDAVDGFNLLAGGEMDVRNMSVGS